MIQMLHVFKSFAANSPALEDITFRVEAGEFAILTGPSGAGKTTLLRLLYAAERPDRGYIIVNGRNLTRLARWRIPEFRRSIGIVFQDFKLLPTKTAFENVAFAQRVLAIPERQVRRRVADVLKRVGISHRKDALPPQLSGGEQQRVALARALVNEPALILADEPTGNLDDVLAQEILALLYELNADGTTILIATHDRELVASAPGRVLTLDHGRLLSS
ncbi:MAG TPA: cell division ATP-binding protein FtsE [Candidatus Tectomicrobia bacterium]|nr:cell division ATP-binding protein FtsE [Candidatus Tectomicrobia bacterium]